MHSVGKCEPPFTSAGPHFNPAQKKHGKLNPEGHHAGDMDNIVVPASGNLALKMVNKDITLEKGKPNSVFQEGGTAVVVHAAKDDYTTDPTGNAGDRIACGVVKVSIPRSRGPGRALPGDGVNLALGCESCQLARVIAV